MRPARRTCPRNITGKDCNPLPMPINVRHLAVILVAGLTAWTLSGCASINERLSAGISDTVPAWAGGLPADAPPRPGTAKYDEFMRERERKRLMPASERAEDTKSDGITLEPVH